MQRFVTTLRRRGFLPSVGGAAAIAFGSAVWLAAPSGMDPIPVVGLEEDVAAAPVSPPVPSAEAGPEAALNENAIEALAVARVIAVRSWAPANSEHPLVFVCPDSAVLGRAVVLTREANAAQVAGLAVAAPEWAGPCDEARDEPHRAGAALRIVLGPADYVSLMRGLRGWDVGSLRVALGPAEDVAPAESGALPAIAAR